MGDEVRMGWWQRPRQGKGKGQDGKANHDGAGSESRCSGSREQKE